MAFNLLRRPDPMILRSLSLALALFASAPSGTTGQCDVPAQPRLAELVAAVGEASTPDAQETNRYLLALPGQRQFSGFDCGAASLLSLMDYFAWRGDDPAPKDFAREIGTNWKDGTSVRDVLAAAAHLKMPTHRQEGMTLEDLERTVYGGRTWREVRQLPADRWLAESHPVMVLYQAYRSSPNRKWASDWADGHWSVVIGIDDKNVYLMDPSMNGKRGFIPRDEFLERWHDADGGKGSTRYVHLGIAFDLPAGVSAEDLNTASYGRFAPVP